jgi:hypothetical protein
MRDLQENSAPPPDASGLPTLREHGFWMRFRKGSLLGNMLTALGRMRRVPINALSSSRAARSDRRRGYRSPPVKEREFQAVCLIPTGPGDLEPLRDTLDSVLHYEGAETKVIVVDDSSTDCRASVIQVEFPEVDVVRRSWPSAPPHNLPTVADGLDYALGNYSFDVLVKLDTDALAIADSPSAAAAQLFQREPRVGLAGTFRVGAEGLPETYDWDAWVLRHTERWNPSVRRLLDRARSGGYDGAKVHGGVYALSRPALEAMKASGDLDWREPWWTPLGEDFWLSVMALANGFAIGSLGGPGEPYAVASKYVPVSKERLLREGRVAIHSVRRGNDGEDEATLRAFFRKVRGNAQAGSGAGVATDSSRPPGR